MKRHGDGDGRLGRAELVRPAGEARPVTLAMKAITIWQPWASLIMIGAKPFEFRRWDFRTRGILPGERIVIHAGSRKIKPQEIRDLISDCLTGKTSLNPSKALPLLRRLDQVHECKGVLELSAGLGTAILGRPRKIGAPFKTPGSDRIDHHMWAWPLGDIAPFEPPVRARGMQGFWKWPP